MITFYFLILKGMCSIFGLNENSNKISVSKIGKKSKLLFRVFMVVSLFGQKIYASQYKLSLHQQHHCGSGRGNWQLNFRETQNLFICWFVCTLWQFSYTPVNPRGEIYENVEWTSICTFYIWGNLDTMVVLYVWYQSESKGCKKE